jgi:hypothetical protein
MLILLHPLTVLMRIFEEARYLPGAASVVFYLLDAHVRLREQYFRLSFLLSNRILNNSCASLTVALPAVVLG